jgi:hypothetical protein
MKKGLGLLALMGNQSRLNCKGDKMNLADVKRCKAVIDGELGFLKNYKKPSFFERLLRWLFGGK